MEGETVKATVSWENGLLAPVDRLRSDRADSPTPGLVEGTEPGELSSARSHLSKKRSEIISGVIFVCFCFRIHVKLLYVNINMSVFPRQMLLFFFPLLQHHVDSRSILE